MGGWIDRWTDSLEVGAKSQCPVMCTLLGKEGISREKKKNFDNN